MKKLMMLVLAAVFSAGAAYAGGDKEKVDFSNLDQDGDGQLSRTEVAQNAELAAQFSTIDANGDGYLAEDEVSNADVQEISQEGEEPQEDDTMGEDY